MPTSGTNPANFLDARFGTAKDALVGMSVVLTGTGNWRWPSKLVIPEQPVRLAPIPSLFRARNLNSLQVYCPALPIAIGVLSVLATRKLRLLFRLTVASPTR